MSRLDEVSRNRNSRWIRGEIIKRKTTKRIILLTNSTRSDYVIRHTCAYETSTYDVVQVLVNPCIWKLWIQSNRENEDFSYRLSLFNFYLIDIRLFIPFDYIELSSSFSEGDKYIKNCWGKWRFGRARFDPSRAKYSEISTECVCGTGIVVIDWPL